MADTKGLSTIRLELVASRPARGVPTGSKHRGICHRLGLHFRKCGVGTITLIVSNAKTVFDSAGKWATSVIKYNHRGANCLSYQRLVTYQYRE